MPVGSKADGAVDEGAKGYEVDSFISEDEVLVESITSREVTLRIDGIAPVTLHHGKGEEAAEIHRDFPFWMRMKTPVAKATSLQYVDSHFDDLSWYL